MAVEGIGNLVQNLADHLFQQEQASPTVPQVVGARSVGSGAATQDTFTPSTQNNSTATDAQAAGIFQLNAGTLATVTTGGPPSQAPSNAAPNESRAQTGVGNPGAAHTTTAAPVNPDVNSGQAASGPAATAKLQLEIQRLNASLPALGLTNTQIQQIDRIASLIGDFNPAAYANLVNQFETQSQNASQQVASLPQSATFGSAPHAMNATDNGSQFREILTRAANSQENARPNLSNGGSGASTSPTAHAPGLQSRQSEFASPNANGQNPQTQPSH